MIDALLEATPVVAAGRCAAARLTPMAPPVVLVHGFGTSFDLTWVANGWVDYGPFWSGQMQVELDALSGNPDVYLQLGAPPTESSYRARSAAAGLGSEFLRDYAPLQWTYVRGRANGAASSWNIRFKYY